MSEWIPVSERVPEEDGAVLGCLPSADPDKPLLMVVWYDPSFGWSLFPKGWRVSHWMPLPEPPK